MKLRAWETFLQEVWIIGKFIIIVSIIRVINTYHTNLYHLFFLLDNSASDICRFQFSSTGCRFGAKCRFRHSGGGGGSNSGDNNIFSPSSRGKYHSGYPSSSATPCANFQNGHCQFGDSCHFSHAAAGATASEAAVVDSNSAVAAESTARG